MTCTVLVFLSPIFKPKGSSSVMLPLRLSHVNKLLQSATPQKHPLTSSSPMVHMTNQQLWIYIVHKFTLNKAQERAFRIIAYHSLGRSKLGPQLRMGVFGEGGTG